MDENTVVIQVFEPEHLDAVVQLHQESFAYDTNFSMQLGPRFLRATYSFFLEDPKAFGFVALYQEKVVGFLCGRLDYYSSALDKYRAPAAMLALLRRPWLLFEEDFRGKLQKSVSILIAGSKSKKDKSTKREAATATLASLGVDPDYAHLRVSDSLLAAAESLCMKNRMRFVRASVQRSNISSRFLYRRRAYTEELGKTTEDGVYYYLSLEDKE